MKNLGILLSWITVKDLTAAIEFYTEIAGFTLAEHHPEFGWAELTAPQGARLGLCQENKSDNVKAGSNAIITIAVDNIEKAKDFFLEKKVTLIGEIQQVPGHVKIQTFSDTDGNVMQLVEML